MQPIVTLKKADWRDDPAARAEAVSALESGSVLYIPDLGFPTETDEERFFRDADLQLKSKNVSYDPSTNQLRGLKSTGEAIDQDRNVLGRMMQRYSRFSRDLCASLLGEYAERLSLARTSFRPVEIEGRKSRSVGSDDTLLHVDAFPSRPMGGCRILRVFCNANPDGKPRVWNVGEPFPDLASRFAPRIRSPWPGERAVLRMLNVTKSYRTLYDHYMLCLHDDMKRDSEYQRTVPRVRVEFPPGVTWMCFADQVSHAVLSGQHMLEQTLSIEVSRMGMPERSPLKILESILQKPLL
jgi:hypothetical protein